MPLFFFLIGITALAAISPGPDTIIISRNALIHGRHHGLATALGCIFGLMIHMSYCLLGIATILESSPLVWNLLKMIGACYIIYLGFKLIRSRPKKKEEETQKPTQYNRDIKKSFLEGFFCDLLNPMVVVFFLGIFTQIIHPHMPRWEMVGYAGIIIATIALWYTILAYLISLASFRNRLIHLHVWIDRIFGLTLILFALKIVL